MKVTQGIFDVFVPRQASKGIWGQEGRGCADSLPRRIANNDDLPDLRHSKEGLQAPCGNRLSTQLEVLLRDGGLMGSGAGVVSTRGRKTEDVVEGMTADRSDGCADGLLDTPEVTSEGRSEINAPPCASRRLRTGAQCSRLHPPQRQRPCRCGEERGYFSQWRRVGGASVNAAVMKPRKVPWLCHCAKAFS